MHQLGYIMFCTMVLMPEQLLLKFVEPKQTEASTSRKTLFLAARKSITCTQWLHILKTMKVARMFDQRHGNEAGYYPY